MGKKTGAVRDKKSSKINDEKGKTAEVTQKSVAQDEAGVIAASSESRSRIKSLLRIARAEKRQNVSKQEKDASAKTKVNAHKDGRGIRAREGRERTKRGVQFKEIVRFFQSVWSEIKKVHWPNRSELIVYTAVVIGSVAFVALLIWIADSILSRLLELILR